MSRRGVQIKLQEKTIVAAAHVAGILFDSSGSIQMSFMNFELDVVFPTKTNSAKKAA